MRDKEVLVALAAIGIAICSAGTGIMVVEHMHATSAPSVGDVAALGPPATGNCGVNSSVGENASCAQWRATIAAEQSADWAWYQLILSALGVLGLAATLTFNWFTIRLALSGQKDTERAIRASERSASASAGAARAASESNQIARETMQRQLPPTCIYPIRR